MKHLVSKFRVMSFVSDTYFQINIFGISNVFPCSITSSSFELGNVQFDDPHPFAPEPLQPLLHYYGYVRPCIPIRAECRFSRSLFWPDLDSCCLNTGCRVVSKQVSSTLVRARIYELILTSSKISMLHRTVHFRSTFQTIRDSSFPAFSGDAHHYIP